MSPDRCCVRVTPYNTDKTDQTGTSRARLLSVKGERTFAELLVVLRRRMKLQPSEALFLLLNRTLVSPQAVVRDVHVKHADADGVLQLRVSRENVFG